MRPLFAQHKMGLNAVFASFCGVAVSTVRFIFAVGFAFFMAHTQCAFLWVLLLLAFAWWVHRIAVAAVSFAFAAVTHM